MKWRSRNTRKGSYRYACMCLPACRIIQTGILSTDSPRAARNSKGSFVANERDDCMKKTNNGNASSEFIVRSRSRYLCLSRSRSPFSDRIDMNKTISELLAVMGVTCRYLLKYNTFHKVRRREVSLVEVILMMNDKF